MISDKKLEANRNNALRSTGPNTKDGRKRSSMNAFRHGITGQVTVMTTEDRAAHQRLSESLVQDLAPDASEMEIQLAQRIASDMWRLNRASATEENLLALGLYEGAGQLCPDHEQIDAALTTARVFREESHHLQLLTLYEQRLNRSIQKNLALLESLQAARKARRETEMKAAAELLQVSEMTGQEYEPAKDGFVFSNSEIYSAIDRQQRLRRASATDFTKFRPRTIQKSIQTQTA
jgi:transcription termination factor NusB